MDQTSLWTVDAAGAPGKLRRSPMGSPEPCRMLPFPPLQGFIRGMSAFFFYGALLDHDVMALVIGRRLPPSAFVPSSLKGHVRRRAKGVSYPILLRDPGGEVEGVVVGGLTRRHVGRLTACEGPRYRIALLKVTIGGVLKTVSVFEPKEASFQPVDGAWDLALWQGRYKRPFVARLRKAFSAR